MPTLGIPPSPRADALRDGLARRQREAPAARLLVGPAADARWARVRELAEHRRVAAAERALIGSALAGMLGGVAPRAVVIVAPDDASDAGRALLAALAAAGARDLMVADADADAAAELPLPRSLARPRLYACLGNALGGHSTVGAVRALRAIRAAMAPQDRLLLGVDVRRDRGQLEAAYNDAGGVLAAYYEHLLPALNRELGADFDPSRFHYRAVYDAENRRVEMHLVAGGAVQATVPGLGPLSFRKGDSIRAAVRCVYDRARLTAMLDGVGLGLREWATDESDSVGLALAAPAVVV